MAGESAELPVLHIGNAIIDILASDSELCLSETVGTTKNNAKPIEKPAICTVRDTGARMQNAGYHSLILGRGMRHHCSKSRV